MSFVDVDNGSRVYDYFFFIKQKAEYEVRIGDWSSDVCSSDLPPAITEAKAMHLVREGAEALLALVPEETRLRTKAATGAARDTANGALAKERALRGLIQPQPSPVEDRNAAGKPAYTDSECREMQRLIESKQ